MPITVIVGGISRTVKNIWVRVGGVSRKVNIGSVRAGSSRVAHLATHTVTNTTPALLSITPVGSSREVLHGNTLVYSISATYENQFNSVTSTWGTGNLIQPEPGTPEWNYTTPGITSDGAVTFLQNDIYIGISAHPVNRIIFEGQNTTLSVSANTNTGSLSYQWMFSTNSGGSWTNIGGNSFTLSISSATTSMSGRWYRCRITNTTSGNFIDSNHATLTVNAITVSFTTQHTTMNEGEARTWTISATSGVTPLYWDIVHGSTNSSDFSATSGNITMSSGSGSFSITTLADLTTEGNETFNVRIYADPGRTISKLTGSTVTLVDTSTTPASPTPNLTILDIDGTTFPPATTSFAGIRMLSTGQLQIAYGETLTWQNVGGSPSQWLTQIATGNGDNYYVRCTLASGQGTPVGTYGSDLQLNTTRDFYITKPSAGAFPRVLTVVIKNAALETLLTHNITLSFGIDSL